MSDLFGHNTDTAVVSDCGRYRYRLTRGQAPFVAWLMLNPSTADAQADDPTIRRCCKFARSWGYGGIIKAAERQYGFHENHGSQL